MKDKKNWPTWLILSILAIALSLSVAFRTGNKLAEYLRPALNPPAPTDADLAGAVTAADRKDATSWCSLMISLPDDDWAGKIGLERDIKLIQKGLISAGSREQVGNISAIRVKCLAFNWRHRFEKAPKVVLASN